LYLAYEILISEFELMLPLKCHLRVYAYLLSQVYVSHFFSTHTCNRIWLLCHFLCTIFKTSSYL